MKHTGTANLPLHGGKAPKWLFGRMVKLAQAITEVFIEERGHDQFIHHVSDPFWFQSLSCVLGFDWHSSGTTTVTCHALKDALKHGRMGLKVLGGKGAHSKKVPTEIIRTCSDFNIASDTEERLLRTTRLVAKIDNAALQDGYHLYHHSFLLSEEGKWAVIQQGMNLEKKYARRYHWSWDHCADFLNDPHMSILSDGSGNDVLNLAAGDSEDNRRTQIDIINDSPGTLKRDFDLLKGMDIRAGLPENQMVLDSFDPELDREIHVSSQSHARKLDMPRRLNWNTIQNAYEIQPERYEDLLLMPGFGPKTVRAISLISELIYGDEASWSDPVRYSFALGGKDGVPYPVDRPEYDNVIELYREAIGDSKLGKKEKLLSLRRLRKYSPPYS